MADEMDFDANASRRRTWGSGPRLIAAGQLVVADPRPAGVHALRRQQRVDRAEVGRGKADLRPAAGAVRDHAANAIRRGEQLVAPARRCRRESARGRASWRRSRRRFPRAERHRARCRPRPPARRSRSIVPSRLWPKIKVGPSTSARAASASRTMRSKELVRRELQQRFVGRIGDDPIDAVGGQQLGLALGPGERRRHCSGRNSRTGCGSNVNTIAGPPTASARCNSRRTIATCPRCTPSKLPIDTAPPRAAAGRASRWRMMCMRSREQGAGSRESGISLRLSACVL